MVKKIKASMGVAPWAREAEQREWESLDNRQARRKRERENKRARGGDSLSETTIVTPTDET